MNNKHKNDFNLQKLKKMLGKTINAGRNIGLSDEIIESSAKKIGDLVALITHPDSESEKLILNLWKNADNEEKKVLSRLLIRMIDNNNNLKN